MATKTTEKSTDMVRRYVIGDDGVDKDRKQLTCLYLLDEKGKHNEDLPKYITKRAGALRMMVGHVYEIPTSEDGKTFSVGQKKWICEYDDSETVLLWQTRQTALDMATRASKIEKKNATDDSHLMTAIEPIRRAYRGMAINQRTAFEAWLLAQLRQGEW